MGRRFVPPPGWPPPPHRGWQPPEGWRPDPAWPSPPPGWQLWVDEPDRTPSAGGWVVLGCLGVVGLLVVGVLGLVALGLAVGDGDGDGAEVAGPAASASAVRTPGEAGGSVPTPSASPTLTRTPSRDAATPAGGVDDDADALEPRDPTAPAAVPAGAVPAVVVSVTDGDTVRLRAADDAGVLPAGELRVRLLEVDAPEVSGGRECFGPEATARLTELAGPGDDVWVTYDVDRQDRFDRELLYLWDEGGLFVNRRLVLSGHATAVLFEPNDRYIEVMRSAEAEARAAGRGLWSACDAPDGSAAAPPSVPTRTTAPPPARSPQQPAPGSGCDPNYAGTCVPVSVADLDCGDIRSPVTVVGRDVHRFDSDGDGRGCESYG